MFGSFGIWDGVSGIFITHQNVQICVYIVLQKQKHRAHTGCFFLTGLGVSRPIYVDVDSPNLGFPYFNFLGGYQ